MKRQLKKELNLSDGEWYPGKVIGVDEFEGGVGPSLKIRVNVNDGETTDEISVLATDNYKASTKLGAFVNGILGILPDEFDESDLENQECEVEVAKQRNKDGTVKTSKTGVPYFTIVAFRPAGQRTLGA
jgi:hypothetical protein